MSLNLYESSKNSLKIKCLENNEIWKDYHENNHNDIQAFDITILIFFFFLNACHLQNFTKLRMENIAKLQDSLFFMWVKKVTIDH